MDDTLCVRGAFKAHEYGDVILPFVVLHRLDFVLEFVHTKLDLYKKLTKPKVNEMLKRQWFEVLASGMSDEGASQGQ